MADHRVQHTFHSQRVKHAACTGCGQKVIEFIDMGLPVVVDAQQAPISLTPIQHHQAGRMVWRLNLATGRWRYNPGSPRGENPVHLEHDCPTAGRS